MALASASASTQWTERRILLLALTLLGLVAALLFVPGIFTVDEDNAVAWLVALRSGRLSLPGTDGLPASRELLFFEPAVASRGPGPALSSVPPLYALFALPFSWLGFESLVLPNLLAWLGTAALIVGEARRQACTRLSAWTGGLAFALAGFSLEYAAGVWPHALSAFLCFTAFVLALRAMDAGRATTAALAGLCAGVAAGVRYPNAVFAAAVGLAVLLLARRRWRLSFAYALGVVLPTLACAAINRARMGSFHPFSKGPGYTHLPVPGLAAPPAHAYDTWYSFVGRVVDFSLYPKGALWTRMGGRYGDSGALLLLSAVKKALLQSAPWILLALVVMTAAWRRVQPADGQRRTLRAALLVCGAIMLLFALAGTKRDEGWSHSQRYLFDLVPVAALALALRLSTLMPTWRSLVFGATAGAAMAGTFLLFSPASLVRQLALLRVPLLLAVVPVALLLVGRRWPGLRRFEAPTLAVCLGWATVVHLGDDLPAARAMRAANRQRRAAVEAILPRTPSAVFAHQPAALGPLLFDRDVVVADTAVDAGRDAPALIDAMHKAGRRVFAVLVNMPEAERARVTAARALRPVADEKSGFVEIVGP